MPPPHPALKNLPNFLTIMRMVAVPVIVVIMLFIWPDFPASRLDQELIASSGWWENVLETLSNCNSCDLYLNPIDNIQSISNIELEPNSGFSPEINRLILSVMGIDTVPVLVVKSDDGYQFIRGESKIVNYVQHACFTDADVLYLDDGISTDDQGLTVITDRQGECSVAIDCEP